MTEKRYNGWTNYETWLIALYISNDEGEQNLWTNQARAMSESKLADALKEYHEEAAEAGKESLPYFAQDLLSAAFSEVNWREIAKDLQEEEAAESEEEAA
jgi:hypothetical protein